MARGRMPDPPGLQEAKGNPGRRKSAVQKRIEEAERVAALLAAAPAGNDPLAVPPIIAGSAPAVAIWRELAPRLARTHRLQPHHRPIFALFCVYFAEWVVANEDIGRSGQFQRVKTVSGSMMERRRPIADLRDRAFGRVMELSKAFGLTPSDEYTLFRDQAVAAAQSPGLFGDADVARKPADDGEPGEQSSGLIGAMADMDSAPPTIN